VLRYQATQNATQSPPDQKYYNCEEKGHYFNGCPNPRIHRPYVPIMNIAPTSSEKTAKVCFHCGQRGHFALQCSDRCQRQTPPDKKCYNCEEKEHFAIACSNPRSRPPLPPSTNTAPNHKRDSTSVKATTPCFINVSLSVSNLAICVEQLILCHAYDEYLVWHKTGHDKSGTRAVSIVGTLA
jgi:hypothetical protein